MAAIEENGRLIPKIKISETIEKITNPDFKTIYRFYNKTDGEAVADYVTLFDETVDTDQPVTIFDPDATWKKKTLTNVTAKKILVQVFEKGKCVYDRPSLEEIRAYCKDQVDHLWDEVKRFENPHKFYVDLSPKLWEIKQRLAGKPQPVLMKMGKLLQGLSIFSFPESLQKAQKNSKIIKYWVCRSFFNEAKQTGTDY